MPLINLTPHPIAIYNSHVPGIIDVGAITAAAVIAPSEQYPPARLGMTDLGTNQLKGCPVLVEFVEYGHLVDALPEPQPEGSRDTWYVVPLVVALGNPHRGDLLVPYREVRDVKGTVVGCRMLARPV